MTSTVTPILATRDVDRLRTFYATLFDASEVVRTPEEGPVFYLGLRIGDSDLGLVSNAEVQVGQPVRVLLSVDVADVDALLPRVEALGGSAPGPANDMPWGQRVAHISDPDGNVVNLTQPISAPVHSPGAG
jgi:predicted enzyme related to lactoylglutathione lyase